MVKLHASLFAVLFALAYIGAFGEPFAGSVAGSLALAALSAFATLNLHLSIRGPPGCKDRRLY